MRFVHFVFITAFSLAAVSCSENKDTPSPRGDKAAGGTLIISMGSDPEVLIPPLIRATPGKLISDMMFEQVAVIGDDMNTIGTTGFTGRLADGWEWSGDSLSIAFHLNPKARWHDDRPVVASDVKYTFDLYRNPKSSANGVENLTNIDSVTVRDSSTFVVWYHERTPTQFFEFVSNVTPIPAHVYASEPPDKLAASPIARTPIGSGRFRFAKWVTGSLVELVADTTHWRGRPPLDRLIFSVTSDHTALMAKVLSGEADFTEVLRGDAVKQAAASKIVVPIVRPSLAYAAMIFRLRGPDDKRPHPVLGDRQVRRAMAMAIDRPTLVRNILDTLGAPGIGPIVRALRVAGTEDKQLPHNVEAAKALLDSAGWRLPPGESVRQRAGKRLEFHLLVNATNATQSNAAAIVQDQLKKVGVQVHVDAIEHNLVVKQFMAKKFDAVMLGFQADASPSGIRQNWTTEAAHSDGGFNRSGYESPAFDATVDSAASSFDPATSAELYKRAVAILLADVPAIWVYEARGTGAVHRRVRTAPMRADYWWAHLDEWSIDPAKMIARDSIGLRAPTP